VSGNKAVLISMSKLIS